MSSDPLIHVFFANKLDDVFIHLHIDYHIYNEINTDLTEKSPGENTSQQLLIHLFRRRSLWYSVNQIKNNERRKVLNA